MPEKKSLLLRMSPELFAELQRLAAQEFRSVNGQIESMLWEGLRKRGRTRGKEPPAIESEDQSDYGD